MATPVHEQAAEDYAAAAAESIAEARNTPLAGPSARYA
jgi:hypothetical protein